MNVNLEQTAQSLGMTIEEYCTYLLLRVDRLQSELTKAKAIMAELAKHIEVILNEEQC